MREAVFSALGTRVAEARFADLFAGSGSYGLEAWSRGATGGVFVEKDPRAGAALQENIARAAKSMGARIDSVRLLRADASRFADPGQYDLVFMDPPYELARARAAQLLQTAGALLAPGTDAVVVFELPGELAGAFPGWTCLRRLGKSGANEPSVALLQPQQAGD
jgi:16S rRNA (guanine966-N2)-methyltransferase